MNELAESANNSYELDTHENINTAWDAYKSDEQTDGMNDKNGEPYINETKKNSILVKAKNEANDSHEMKNSSMEIK